MEGHAPLRARRPGRGAAAAAIAGLVLVTGCGVAPAGADNDSPAIGPTSAVSAGKFPAFPVPATYAGYQNQQYTALGKAVTGAGDRNLHVDAGPNLVFWLSCLGPAGGTARLSSPDLGLDWAVPCGTGSAADPQAINFQPTTGVAAGTPVKVLVSVTAGDRWEVRVDVPNPNATASPSPEPSRTP